MYFEMPHKHNTYTNKHVVNFIFFFYCCQKQKAKSKRLQKNISIHFRTFCLLSYRNHRFLILSFFSVFAFFGQSCEKDRNTKQVFVSISSCILSSLLNRGFCFVSIHVHLHILFKQFTVLLQVYRVFQYSARWHGWFIIIKTART